MSAKEPIPFCVVSLIVLPLIWGSLHTTLISWVPRMGQLPLLTFENSISTRGILSLVFSFLPPYSPEFPAVVIMWSYHMSAQIIIPGFAMNGEI